MSNVIKRCRTCGWSSDEEISPCNKCGGNSFELCSESKHEDTGNRRCVNCGWPANQWDRYCCKCGRSSFVKVNQSIPSYSHFVFPPCECLSNGTTIQYNPSLRNASKITLQIKSVRQVFESYIIYEAEKIVEELHYDIEVAELYIKGKDHRSLDGSRIASQNEEERILEKSFFDFIVQDSGISLRQVLEYYNDEYGLSKNCIRANNTLYYILTNHSWNNDDNSTISAIGSKTPPLDSILCQHCGTIFSAKDKCCPNCGKPFQTWKNVVKKIVRLLTIVYLIIISGYSIYISNKYSQLQRDLIELRVERIIELEQKFKEIQENLKDVH